MLRRSFLTRVLRVNLIFGRGAPGGIPISAERLPSGAAVTLEVNQSVSWLGAVTTLAAGQGETKLGGATGRAGGGW